MVWKPNRWIALVLNLLLSPAGLLYVGKGGWAVAYLLINLAIIFMSFLLLKSSENAALLAGIFNLAILVISTTHAFLIANRSQASSSRPWYSRWHGIALIFVGIGAPIFLTRAFFFEPFRLPSASMEPSFMRGSQIVITKFGYGNYGAFGISIYRTQPTKQLQRGDTIVFSWPKDPSLDYFKRVIGLPGDTVEYRSKHLFINGKPTQLHLKSSTDAYEIFEEKYDGSSWPIRADRGVVGQDFSVAVPDGMYFVMGDNRDNSNDSRYWGYVPTAAIKGKTLYSFY